MFCLMRQSMWNSVLPKLTESLGASKAHKAKAVTGWREFSCERLRVFWSKAKRRMLSNARGRPWRCCEDSLAENISWPTH